jgi:hypothetical protein
MGLSIGLGLGLGRTPYLAGHDFTPDEDLQFDTLTEDQFSEFTELAFTRFVETDSI